MDHNASMGIAAGNVIESQEQGGEFKAVKFSTNHHLSAAAPPFGSLCYPIPTFNRPIKPLESFLPISYALLAGRP